MNLVLAIPLILAWWLFADERDANRLAHEVCPQTHVVRAGDAFAFSCQAGQFRVVCSDGSCVRSAR